MKINRKGLLISLLCGCLFFAVPSLSCLLMEVSVLTEGQAFKNNLSLFREFVNSQEEAHDFTWKEYYRVFSALMKDVSAFPVVSDKEECSYEDSWGGQRTYGGERRHEGTDIMPPRNEAGVYPIVSVSDGIVEKKGWLELGGNRLGIRSSHGFYFYYAHLSHYAEGIEEGTRVKAGDIIGYMGDSGYGKEGTTGMFAVHLHFGIYYSFSKEEFSVNPYEILNYLKQYGVHTDKNL